jgi:hypothetical protein
MLRTRRRSNLQPVSSGVAGYDLDIIDNGQSDVDVVADLVVRDADSDVGKLYA